MQIKAISEVRYHDELGSNVETGYYFVDFNDEKAFFRALVLSDELLQKRQINVEARETVENELTNRLSAAQCVVPYLPFEDGFTFGFVHKSLGEVFENGPAFYDRYLNPFLLSHLVICLECPWSFNNAAPNSVTKVNGMYTAATRSPSNERLVTSFLTGFGSAQLNVAEGYVANYKTASKSTNLPKSIVSISLYIGDAYSRCVTTDTISDWKALMTEMFAIATPTLESLSIYESENCVFNMFEHAISHHIFPRLRNVCMPRITLENVSNDAKQNLTETVEHLNLSTCGAEHVRTAFGHGGFKNVVEWRLDKANVDIEWPKVLVSLDRQRNMQWSEMSDKSVEKCELLGVNCATSWLKKSSIVIKASTPPAVEPDILDLTIPLFFERDSSLLVPIMLLQRSRKITVRK